MAMNILLAALAGTLLSIGFAKAQTPGDPPMPDSAAIAQMLADRIDRDGQSLGIAIGVVAAGRPDFVAHGHLAAGGAVVDMQTVFEIGSVSKIFTNLLLADMVLRGDMVLDAPVADYLPAGTVLPRRDGQQITLFDLATHSSGLPRMPANFTPADPANPYADYGVDKLYAFLAGYSLPRAIGTQFEYSNLGTALLGEALVTTAGMDYQTLVRHRILEPLGMTETAVSLPPELAARFATGHDAQLAPTPHWNFDVFAPAGGLRSTTADMVKFIAAASGATSTPLKGAFALMLARTRPVGPKTTIGLGWLILEQNGRTSIWHNGGTDGFRSFVGFDPATGSGVVALANAATPIGVDDIGLHLLNPATPLAPQPRRHIAVTIDPALLGNYVGDYALSPQFILIVTSENGRLFVEATDQHKHEVFPEGEHKLFYTVVDAQLSFTMGLDGKARSVVLHQNGEDITGARQP